jgi:hypothetical protein
MFHPNLPTGLPTWPLQSHTLIFLSELCKEFGAIFIPIKLIIKLTINSLYKYVKIIATDLYGHLTFVNST